MMFDVHELPQIPSIQFWRTSGGSTSERGADSSVPAVRGVVKDGAVVVDRRGTGRADSRQD